MFNTALPISEKTAKTALKTNRGSRDKKKKSKKPRCISWTAGTV